MSTPARRRPTYESARERFPYGWREVYQLLPDGRRECEQIPLTLEEALHPQEDYVVPQGSAHSKEGRYLAEAFELRLAPRADVLVLNDTIIDWDDPVLKTHCPDVSVIFGVRDLPRDFDTFQVGKEKVRSKMLTEVVSRNTRVNDVVTKVEQYFQAKVPYYIIVDVHYVRKVRTLSLIGHRAGRRAYEPLEPNERGWLWLEPVRLWLSVEDNRLVLRDEHEEKIGTYKDVSLALQEAQSRADQEKERADQEKERADAAERKIAKLEAELRARKGPASGNGKKNPPQDKN